MDGPSWEELLSVKPSVSSNRVRRYVLRRALWDLKARYWMKMAQQSLGLLLGIGCLAFSLSISSAALEGSGTAVALHEVILSNNAILNLSKCVRGNDSDTWFYLWQPPLLQMNVTRTNAMEQVVLHQSVQEMVSHLRSMGIVLLAALFVMAASEFAAHKLQYSVWRRFIVAEDVSYTRLVTEYLEMAQSDVDFEEFFYLNTFLKRLRKAK